MILSNSMINRSFLWALTLWAMLHATLTLSAKQGMGQKDKIEGRMAPSDIISELPPTSSNFTKARKQYPGKFFRAVLKDQLRVEELEYGPAYVFMAFRPGTLYEDVGNGGKQ